MTRLHRLTGWCPQCEQWLCGMPRWLTLQAFLWTVGAWSWWVARWEPPRG